jgi:hypothetical protein
MTIWRMRNACWITKGTNTISQYVIRIDFPLQQWLHESSCMLRYRHIAPNLHFEDNMEWTGIYDLLLRCLTRSRKKLHALNL